MYVLLHLYYFFNVFILPVRMPTTSMATQFVMMKKGAFRFYKLLAATQLASVYFCVSDEASISCIRECVLLPGIALISEEISGPKWSRLG